MAFKLKSGFLKASGFKKMGATASPLTKTSPLKAEEKAYGGDRTWSEGQKASGGTLDDMARKGKTLEKGSREWNINQNKINEALGSKKRYDVADKPADTSKTSKVTGRTTTTTTDDKGAVDTTVTRKDGSVKKTVDQTNLSTYDAEKGTGSSGLGMEETTQKYKKSGEAKRGSKTTYSKGTDTKKDDKVVRSKKQRKPGGRGVVKTKDKETGAKSKSVIRGAKGNRWTQKSKSKDAAGTVTKTKHYTTGKKAGTSKTTERKKGQLFGKKVDVDYS